VANPEGGRRGPGDFVRCIGEGSTARAELLHVLMLPDFDRADRIGEFWGLPGESRLRRAAHRLRGKIGRAGHVSTRMVEQHYAGRLDRADKEIAETLGARHGAARGGFGTPGFRYRPALT
jgi:hypothetical protein